MEKKVQDIVDAFEHCKFEECLRLSDQLMKKIEKGDGKKKNTITEDSQKNIHLCRAGSLAATGQIHAANNLINTEFKEAVVDEKLSFLFLQIVSMVLDPRLESFVEAIEAKKQKKQINVNRFVLTVRKYSALGKIFLKQFMLTKKDANSLGQVYLDYLNEYTKHRKITYSRDRTFVQCKEANFKMVVMFLDKFEKGFLAKEEPKEKNDLNIRNKFKTAIVDLKFKIAIHEANSQKAREIFVSNYQLIKERPFNYLRSIRALSSQKQENKIFYTREYLKIFVSNLDLDQYQPIYDYNDEFLNHFVQQLGQIKLSSPEKIDQEEIYAYHQAPQNQLQNYYNSLHWELRRNLQNQSQLKKKDYYKICNKNILLQLIKISHLANLQEQKQQFLLYYKQQFGKTLTFYGEVLPYLHGKNLEEKFVQKMKEQPAGITKDQDKLIWLINVNKLFMKFVSPSKMEEIMHAMAYYEELYEENVKKIENMRHLQKGERYYSDDFVLIAADLMRIFVERADLSEVQRQECCLKILKVLEKVSQNSPYNFDIKLRIMYFCDILNYYYRIIEIFETMDIKAVQFQTVGYWIIKPILLYGLWDSHETQIVRILRSYQENNRESAQYSYKAIIYVSFNQCEQFLCYNDNLNRSYTFVLLLYILYLKHRHKPESEFYLKQILRRINNIKEQRITFNCDFKVMENIIPGQSSQAYHQFYGIFNNYKILENQCKLKTIIHDLVRKNQPKYDLKQVCFEWKVEDIYDFKDYEYFQREIKYEFGSEKTHHLEKQAKSRIEEYNLLQKVKVTVIELLYKMGFSKKQQEPLQEILSFGEEVLKNIQQLRLFLQQKLDYRKQTKFIPFARNQIIDCLHPLQVCVETYSGKSKKKIEGKVEKKELCNKIIEALFNSVNEGVKINEKLPVSKEFVSEISVHQDEILERLTKMDTNEYKKLYKIK